MSSIFKRITNHRRRSREVLNGRGSWASPLKSNFSGFTLLEVVAALAVFSVAVTLAAQLFTRSLINVRLIGEHTIAASHAESIMNELLLDEDIKEARILGGEFDDGYRWRATVEEIVEPLTAEEQLQPPRELPAKKLGLTVTIYWARGGKDNAFQIESLKLAENERFRASGGGAFRPPPRSTR